MEQQIRAILSGLPGVKVKSEGALWCVNVGSLSGARENGESLALDLRRQYEYIRDRERAAEAAPIAESPAALVTDYEAIIADLKAQLAAKPAFEPHAEPEPVEMPDFLKAPEAPPAELADLFEVADTPAESNEKLLVRLREVLGLIGLAEDAGGRAAPELYRRKDRLESGIRWNRGRSAEVI